MASVAQREDVEFDQWFTREEDAKALVADLLNELPELRGRRFLEPSAGAGSFMRALEVQGQEVEGYDLQPSASGIIKADFLADPVDCSGKVVIGNPPYGVRHALSIAFVRRAFELGAAHVAFLLPLSFMRSAAKAAGYRVEYFKAVDIDSFRAKSGNRLRLGIGVMAWIVLSSAELQKTDQYVRPIDPSSADLLVVRGDEYGLESIAPLDTEGFARGQFKCGAPGMIGWRGVGFEVIRDLPEDRSGLQVVGAWSAFGAPLAASTVNFLLSNPELYRGAVELGLISWEDLPEIDPQLSGEPKEVSTEGYTDDAVAQKLVADLLNELPELRGRSFLEPSAGGGAFIRAVEAHGETIVGCDLRPNAPGIRYADFLGDRVDCRGKVVIGRPPSGMKGGNTADFVKRAFELGATHVAFLLPLSFARNKLARIGYRLIYMKSLVVEVLKGKKLQAVSMAWIVLSREPMDEATVFVEACAVGETSTLWVCGRSYSPEEVEPEPYDKIGGYGAFKALAPRFDGAMGYALRELRAIPEDRRALEVLSASGWAKLQPPLDSCNYWLSFPELYKGELAI